MERVEKRRGHRPLPAVVRERAVTALIEGRVVAEIAKAARVGADRIWGFWRELSPEDRDRRSVEIAARIRTEAVVRKSGDAVMAAVESAVPRSIETALRDDD